MSCINCTLNKNKKVSRHGILYGEGCSTMSHDKRPSADWLHNIDLPPGQKKFRVYEVSFKNGRKDFFRNDHDHHTYYMGDTVVVEGNPGYDVGVISLAGEVVKLQMRRKKKTGKTDELKKIIRRAHTKDLEIWKKARSREAETQRQARIIIRKLGLTMKLSDVAFQGDGKKATFYYTADSRVDFRQLIKELASAFRIRVEMKQVDYRHEASRLGGVGSCGRELCCASWMGEFKKVNNQAARQQQLSLNPQKLQGQCGRLKCCLNHELKTYSDALKDLPSTDIILKTEGGNAKHIKTDVFKKYLWYAYEQSDNNKWYRLEADQVKEIIEKNEKGETVPPLEDWEITEFSAKPAFENPVGEDSLTRFDKPKRKKRKKRRKKPRHKNKSQNKKPS